MWYGPGMRATTEPPDGVGRRVVSAAARNLRGCSQVIVDAPRPCFDGGQDIRQSVAARVRGSLNRQAAERERRRLAEMRANWRT